MEIRGNKETKKPRTEETEKEGNEETNEGNQSEKTTIGRQSGRNEGTKE